MSQCDPNAHVGTDYECSEKESLPFALEDHSTPPKKLQNGNSQISSHDTTPDLTESLLTDSTSCCSTISSPKSDISKATARQIETPASASLLQSTSVFSSIFSTTSLTSVPLEPRFADDSYQDNTADSKATSPSLNDLHAVNRQSDISLHSIGFSELMKAADDSSIELERSHPHTSSQRTNVRLPPLPENQEVEPGALISAPEASESVDRVPNSFAGGFRKWWQNNSSSQIENQELGRPFLIGVDRATSNDTAPWQPHVSRLLSNSTSRHQVTNFAIEQAGASVQTRIESDNSFEVSLFLGEDMQCTVDDVMEVISNIDLLNLWCHPIDTLIVTSTSNEDSSFATGFDESKSSNESQDLIDSSNCRDTNRRIREYEGEWIEATTSTLKSPSSNLSFVLSAGQSLLQSLGLFTSYGRITMFIERRRGQIGLTFGPFHGGIHVSHSISITREDVSSKCGGIQIVDRVRLTRRDEEDAFFLGGVLGCSCLSHLFSPSIDGHCDQVAISMTRLRILLKNMGRTN